MFIAEINTATITLIVLMIKETGLRFILMVFKMEFRKEQEERCELVFNELRVLIKKHKLSGIELILLFGMFESYINTIVNLLKGKDDGTKNKK